MHRVLIKILFAIKPTYTTSDFTALTAILITFNQKKLKKMSVKSWLAKPFAAYEVNKFNHALANPFEYQDKIFQNLLHIGRKTIFGKENGFDSIKNIKDFQNRVEVADYEGIKHYVEKIKNGERNVLWEGLPKYFAKTSGTTSGVKYIPVSDVSIKEQVKAARLALQYYNHESGRTKWVDGKMIFLQGSPEMEKTGGILTGRLSGITYHEVPAYLLKNRKPSYAVNCIEDWEKKVEKIVDETANENMTLISGISPWVIMYFEKLLEKTGKKTVADVFPELELYVHGGVNFEPYQSTFDRLIGRKTAYIETYPASEGFIAFQNCQHEEGLVLNVDGGIFYEFIPMSEYFSENPKRLSLREVELGVQYAVVLNTNAGLWAYSLGDTVKFISLNPFRIVVTGRIKHYISAFGEHVIGEEVEGALTEICKTSRVKVREFTVAPQVNTIDENPFHEWWIDFENAPENISEFALELDNIMRKKNIYYDDLIRGNILQPLKIVSLTDFAFRAYMESEGKLGGQNKIPRLANDRKMVEKLERWKK